MDNWPPDPWESHDDLKSDCKNINNIGECLYDRNPQERKPCTVDDNRPQVSVDVDSPEATKFWIWREHLAHSPSKFFQGIVQRGWFDKHDSIDLPRHSKHTFNFYLEWLRQVKGIDHMTNMAPEYLDWQYPQQFLLLTDAFVLGEDIEDAEFKDYMTDSLLKKLRGPHGEAFWEAAPSMVDAIYAGTCEGSPARKLLADVFAYGMDETQMRTMLPQLPHPFQCELMIAFAASRWAQSFRAMPLIRCEYHQHE